MIKKKKIVIISYAAYPSLTPRSQRTTELASGFARKGHDVTLYIQTGGFDYSEFQRLNNVKVRSLGPTYFLKFEYPQGTYYKFPTKVLKKLVGRFLEFPTIELMRNVYNILMGERDIDLLISVAVPYPLHWGVAMMRQLNPRNLSKTTWVADCGDPFMGNPFNKHPFYFKYVEKWFCGLADYLSIPIEEAREAYYPEFHGKIRVIPQGFNFERINVKGNYRKNSVPTFIYAGIFYEKYRDPRPLIDYLVNTGRDFRFVIYTKSPSLLAQYGESLKDKLVVHEYIPREQLLFEMSKADFLVNLENPTSRQSPSKLIDYALALRPVLSINTNEELNHVVIDEFLIGNYSNAFKIDNLDKYNIDNIVKEFITLINYDGRL